MPTPQIDENLDIMSMSDDQFLDLPDPSTFPDVEEEEEVSVDNTTEPDQTDTINTDNDGDTDTDTSINTDVTDTVETGEQVTDGSSETTETESNTDADDTGLDPTVDGTSNDQESGESTEETTDTKETDTVTDEVDYKALYEEVTKPFMANGHEMHITSPQDIQTMMKMGANYNKKMVAIKPHLKVIKQLEQHGLLDETKLNRMIDISNGDTAAINQFLQERKIDPLDINTDAPYTPKDHSVSDSVIELDTVLDDLKDDPNINTTLDVIGKQWDNASRQVIQANPSLIASINEHVSNGVYTEIAGRMNHERALGRLNGMSDIQAYQAVGDMLAREASAKQAQVPSQQPITPQKQAPVQKPEIDKQRRAAAPTGNGKPKPTITDAVNPINMPDDEFDKLFNEQFS